MLKTRNMKRMSNLRDGPCRGVSNRNVILPIQLVEGAIEFANYNPI